MDGAGFAGAAASFTGSGFWAVCTDAARFNWPRWMGAGAANIQLDTASHAAEKHNLIKADFCIARLVSHNPWHETSRNYREMCEAMISRAFSNCESKPRAHSAGVSSTRMSGSAPWFSISVPSSANHRPCGMRYSPQSNTL